MSQWGEDITFFTENGVSTNYTPMVNSPPWEPIKLDAPIEKLYSKGAVKHKPGTPQEYIDAREQIRAYAYSFVGKPYSEWLALIGTSGKTPVKVPRDE